MSPGADKGSLGIFFNVKKIYLRCMVNSCRGQEEHSEAKKEQVYQAQERTCAHAKREIRNGEEAG
jgi:hypothetical protein